MLILCTYAVRACLRAHWSLSVLPFFYLILFFSLFQIRTGRRFAHALQLFGSYQFFFLYTFIFVLAEFCVCFGDFEDNFCCVRKQLQQYLFLFFPSPSPPLPLCTVPLHRLQNLCAQSMVFVWQIYCERKYIIDNKNKRRRRRKKSTQAKSIDFSQSICMDKVERKEKISHSHRNRQLQIHRVMV